MSPELARPQPGALPIRAVAVLVTMRSGSLTTLQIRNSIADETAEETRSLLRDMEREALLHVRGPRWYLREAGVAYLETNGLTVADEARL